MALKCFLQRPNDIDLTDAHIELQRFDLRPKAKRALVIMDIWQSRDVCLAGEQPLQTLNMWWDIEHLAAVHQIIKGTTAKGLKTLIAAIEKHAINVEVLDDGDFSPTFGATTAADTDPIA